MLPIFALIAFRANTVGADTYSYSYLYEKYGARSLTASLQSNTWLEAGYIFSNYVFYHLGISYYGFQIIVGVFYLVSFYWFLDRYSTNIGLSCFLIVARQGMFGMMNQTRMWLAICVLLFAVDSIKNRRTVKFILLTLLASTFHRSALSILLLYIIVNKRRNKQLFRILYIIICIGVAMLGNSFFRVVTSILGSYENYNVIQGDVKLASIVSLSGYLIFLLSIILVKAQSQEQFEYHEFSIDVIVCTIGLSIIGLRSVVMGRIISYFTVYLYGLVPTEIRQISFASNRRIIAFVVVAMFTILFFATMILRPNWDRVIPYSFMF